MKAVDLGDASLGFYRVWHVAVGAPHGLLREAWATPEALAKRAKLDPAAVTRWCRGAHALGLLQRKGARYRVPPRLAPSLARPDDMASLTQQFEYLARKSLTFGGLEAHLRGERVDVDLTDVYPLATAWDHVAFFELALPHEPRTRKRLEAGADVLDLGAGDGAWARQARARFPHVRVAAAETRDALPRLRRSLRGSGIRALDVAEVPEAAFDLVFMGEVLSAASDPPVPLATAMRALRPGGELHLMEGLLPPPHRGARNWGERLILAMDLDFGMDGSRFLRRDEADAALQEAGLVRRRIRDVGGSLFHLRGAKPKRWVQAGARR